MSRFHPSAVRIFLNPLVLLAEGAFLLAEGLAAFLAVVFRAVFLPAAAFFAVFLAEGAFFFAVVFFAAVLRVDAFFLIAIF